MKALLGDDQTAMSDGRGAETASAHRAQRQTILVRLFGSIEEIIACTALVIVVAAVCWGVLSRYVTAQPAPWAGEVAQMGFAWVVFIAIKAINRLKREQPAPAPAAPPEEVVLLREIRDELRKT